MRFETHTEVIRTVIELILRDGIASGEFEPVDPRETSVLIKRSMVAFCHPLMVAECLQRRRRRDRSAPVRAVPAARHHTSECNRPCVPSRLRQLSAALIRLTIE